jgi:hypothetical protein
MKFFNIDQHASIIADIAHIFKNLGHEVDDWSLSGHHWVMGKPQSKIMLSDGGQLTCSGVCSQEVCDNFYEQNKDELSKYDGFIVCYPVEFALLYERFNKPIIVMDCIRYDHPNTFNPVLRDRLNKFLKRRHSEDTLYYTCNNKGDIFYTQYFLGINGMHIPNLCEYTNAKWTGTKNKFIIHDRSEANVSHNLAISLGAIRTPEWRYTWQDLYSYKGVIHTPYNNGSMSIFEQYTANMPLFLPTKKYAKELFYQGKMFADLTFYKINQACEPDDLSNPNSLRNPAILDKWIDSCDFYDSGNMPYVQYFDSSSYLEHLLQTVNTAEISANMATYNIIRKQSIYNSWQQILTSVASKI